MPPSTVEEGPYFRIFDQFLYKKDFKGAKPVEIPRNQVSFHCKGISMEYKITTNHFSQLRPRKSNDKHNYIKMFLLQLKKLPISCGTVTF